MMKSFMDWINMGGYAFYVWSAYGVVMLVLLANMLSVRRQRLSIKKKLQACYRSNKSS